ncbi:hypothetical protein [Ktedonobacter racemifer]|uniref:hypothetical protein n=1 Tax=Ktedonobacter racemifer TaxID=363277 RepID=UPI0005909360|nr:hypothetical protein [Ktedonobacter racemifer]
MNACLPPHFRFSLQYKVAEKALEWSTRSAEARWAEFFSCVTRFFEPQTSHLKEYRAKFWIEESFIREPFGVRLACTKLLLQEFGGYVARSKQIY